MPWTFWQRIKQKIGTFFFLLVITAPNKPLGLNYMGGGANATKHIDAGTSFDLK